MRRSRMLEKLRRGEYVTMAQSWVIPHWKIVDIMGFVGFDSVWIEHEHSDFTHGDVLPPTQLFEHSAPPH